MRSVITDLKRAASGPRRNRLVTEALADGLPPRFEPALRYLATGALDRDARRRVDAVERIRRGMASREGELEIYYSPKPLSAGEDNSAEARPPAGDVKRFTFEQVANNTSTPKRWGVLLMLLAEASNAYRMIELGSCAGVAAAYLASSRQNPEVVTIEAASGLAALAGETTSQVSDKVTVHNGLFDDVLDDLLSAAHADRYGLAWIDGHHERVATQHYFQRLIPVLEPGSVVLFDDTSWSQDMRDGWDVLSRWTGFSHTVDLGKLGFGIWEGGNVEPRSWDLRDASGHGTRVSDPHGWRD